MAIPLVEELWARIRAHIDDKITAAESAAARAEHAAETAETGVADGAVTRPKLASEVVQELESKADLVGGKVPTSQIPEVALTKPFSVTSRAALLALNAQEGDIGIITAGADKGSYMLGSGPSNVFGSWVQLAVSADAPVSSVNGQTGTVVLNATDVGAAPTDHTHTMSQITDLPTVSKAAQGDALVQRRSNGMISVPATPVSDIDAASKSYVDLEADKRVLKSGTATTLWSGTQAEYDALPTATREAAGFIAVIV